MTIALQIGEDVILRGPNPLSERAPVTATLTDGGQIVCWLSTAATGPEIVAQRYDAAGRAVGQAFVVNATTAGVQDQVVVAALAGGGFVVCWRDASSFSADTSSSAIRAQMFNAAGARVGGELLVNTTTAGFETTPSVTALSGGGFVILWQDIAPFASQDDDTVRAQIFNGIGAKLGPEQLIFNKRVQAALVASLDTGGFVVTLDGVTDPAFEEDVLILRYDSAGGLMGGIQRSNQAVIGGRQAPEAITALENGSIVVLYLDLSGAAGLVSDLRRSIFDATGAFVDDVRVIAGTNPILDANVEALASGGFVVTWTEEAGGSTTAHARAYDLLGAPTGAEFIVGEGTAAHGAPDVAASEDDTLRFVWQEDPPGPGPVLVHSQRWALFTEADGDDSSQTLLGTTGRDRILAFLGDDTVFGGAAGDFLDGGLGNDELFGDAGDDLLFGDRDADILFGGDGDDVLEASGHDGLGGVLDGPDQLVGGDGVDTASYARAIFGVVADLALPAGNVSEAAGDTYAGVENLTGSAFGDTLSGDAGANVLMGRDSDDALVGRGGADRLVGGAGTDVASYSNAPTGVTADLDTPSAGSGDAAGDVFDSIETLVGSSFADFLRGTAGSQTLAGGAGDDVLDGRGGGDILTGGDGNDAASYTFALAGVTADLGAAVNNTGDAAGDSYGQIESLNGSKFADTLRGDGSANTLGGREGADVLQGRGGNDKLFGEAGADVLFGEDGDDVLDGGLAGDNLVGGAGGDSLTGREGADILDGGAGADVASYRDKTVAVVVTLNGSSNVSVNVGGVAEDSIRNIERIYGGSAGDLLTGDSLVNLFNGYDGADVLRGAGGGDFLDGGTGIDRFVYAAIGDSTVAAGGRDTISAFVSGSDDIDVSLIDAKSGTGANDAFTLGVMASGAAGRLQVTANGGGWLVQGDVNGDGLADFAIQVNGTQPVAGDFIL